MPQTLSQSTLSQLPAAVRKPAYERAGLRSGIVHLGLGAFHRAHQAVYTEQLIERGDTRWGIVGVQLRDRRVSDRLMAQDCLYSVTERHGDTAHTRVVGALRSALHAPSQLQQVLAAIADPGVAIVSSTVTEKGYHLNPSDAGLDLASPDIQHDLAHPDAPVTTLGVLAAGLRLRPPGAPVTVLCCDNMAGNGDTLQRLLAQYAGLVDPALARRIEQDIGFPNSMVDRIVPAATPATLDEAESLLGLRDESAIVCEPFTQWVIEDRFTGPRPAWQDAGALLTGDVRPYQAMKLRLLNGSHSAIAYLGQLCDLETVSDTMADPQLGDFVQRLMREDLLSTVAVPAGYDALAYCDELIARFQNPTLAHRTQQIASDGTQKVAVRWLPALRESVQRGIERPLLERALAAWLHYLAEGRSDSGAVLLVNDPGAAPLAARLREAGPADAAVRAALGYASVFGADPWPEAFAGRLVRHLSTLRAGATRALLSPTALA